MKNSPESTSTIERCPHDRENPYTMVSRALIRDNSISPNCRMILIFLLSNDAKKWIIRTDQICNSFEGYLGRDKTRKLINEAIEAGYIRREKYIEKNMTRIKYYISEEPKFKKCYRRPDSQGPEFQGPENQGPLEVASSQESASKETTTKKKKERATPFVVVSLDKDVEKKQESSKPKIHACLESLDEKDAPMKEKLWLNKRYDEETVKNAILWAYNPSTEIKTTIIATIKWACKERPQMAKNEVDQKEHNRIYAMNYDGMEAGGVKIDCCNAYVNFSWIIPCPTPCFCLEYDAKGFMDKFEQKLIQRKFPILR